MSRHVEVWSRSTANLLGWFHSEENAANYTADLYRHYSHLPPGEFIMIWNDEECEEDCSTDDGNPEFK